MIYVRPTSPPWIAYFYLKFALKHHKPQLVLFDVYTTKKADSEFDERPVPDLIGLPPSKDKYDALKATGYSKDDFWDVFWQFPMMHSDYSTLKRDDFIKSPYSSLLGMKLSFHIQEYYDTMFDGSDVFDTSPISQKAEYYLRKMIELCRSEGIDILLINTPYPAFDIDAQKNINYVKTIADEYDVDLINGNDYFNEIGFDLMKDFTGTKHMNYYGMTKWTGYLGETISAKYTLPERRDNDKYRYWSDTAKYLDELIVMQSIEDCMEEHIDESGELNDISWLEDILKNDVNFYGVIFDRGTDNPGVRIYSDGQISKTYDATEIFQSVYYSDSDILRVGYDNDNNRHLVFVNSIEPTFVVDNTTPSPYSFYVYNCMTHEERMQ